MRSIGALSSAAQGASYYERDGYYAKDDPEHRAASAWHGRGGRRARPDLDALGMGAAELARRVEEPVNRISEIVIGCRAWGGFFGTTVTGHAGPMRGHHRHGSGSKSHLRAPVLAGSVIVRSW